MDDVISAGGVTLVKSPMVPIWTAFSNGHNFIVTGEGGGFKLAVLKNGTEVWSATAGSEAEAVSLATSGFMPFS